MTKSRLHLKWKSAVDCQTIILNLSPRFSPLSGPGIHEISYESKDFPGGEPHLKLHFGALRDNGVTGATLVITQRINSVADLFKVIQANDAARRSGIFSEILLFIPYFPAARQDRVCDDGEALTVKIFADMINACSFDQVTICSPHSEVAPALLDNCATIDLDLRFAEEVVLDVIGDRCPIVNIICPDAGAGKRVFKIANVVASKFPAVQVKLIRCEKVRDVTTGALKEFHVASDDLRGFPCIIFDDIVAMGGTFLGLADALKEKNAGSLSIFTCHADCEAGIANLYQKFDRIFTTNSKHDFVEDDKVKIFKIEL